MKNKNIQEYITIGTSIDCWIKNPEFVDDKESYSYSINKLDGKPIVRTLIAGTWDDIKLWMEPIPNVPVEKGSEKWIYKIFNSKDEIVFEGTTWNFVEKYYGN
jgi:hypothetical protein